MNDRDIDQMLDDCFPQSERGIKKMEEMLIKNPVELPEGLQDSRVALERVLQMERERKTAKAVYEQAIQRNRDKLISEYFLRERNRYLMIIGGGTWFLIIAIAILFFIKWAT